MSPISDTQNVMDEFSGSLKGEFSGSLKGRVDSEGLVERWLGVVSETMQPSAAAVWIEP